MNYSQMAQSFLIGNERYANVMFAYFFIVKGMIKVQLIDKLTCSFIEESCRIEGFLFFTL